MKKNSNRTIQESPWTVNTVRRVLFVLKKKKTTSVTDSKYYFIGSKRDGATYTPFNGMNIFFVFLVLVFFQKNSRIFFSASSQYMSFFPVLFLFVFSFKNRIASSRHYNIILYGIHDVVTRLIKTHPSKSIAFVFLLLFLFFFLQNLSIFHASAENRRTRSQLDAIYFFPSAIRAAPSLYYWHGFAGRSRTENHIKHNNPASVADIRPDRITCRVILFYTVLKIDRCFCIFRHFFFLSIRINYCCVSSIFLLYFLISSKSFKFVRNGNIISFKSM